MNGGGCITVLMKIISIVLSIFWIHTIFRLSTSVFTLAEVTVFFDVPQVLFAGFTVIDTSSLKCLMELIV